MFYGLKDRARRLRFTRDCKGILQTSPLVLDESSALAIVTQLQHKDVLMFLLAAKSFARSVRPGAVYVVDDGSLSPEDCALLRAHVPKLTMLELRAFRSDHCPYDGTWERLLAIASLVERHYVVQLDSDTLTIGPIEEVRRCAERQVAFALGTWDKQRIETMPERCKTAQARMAQGDRHVQVAAEAHFDRLSDFSSLRYVRGCSGFAGFARRSFARTFVEDISREMRAALRERWNEWGSEQVMSNIVVANIPGAIVLPHPKYADCHKMQPGATEFVHFIGSCRFQGGHYARLGTEAIAAL